MRLGRRSNGAQAREGRWFGRMARGLRPDRNPLRRTSDRVETYLLAAFFVIAAAATPFAAQAASHAAHTAAVHEEQSQQASRHQVAAVLTQRASASVSGYTTTADVLVQATWRSVTGVRRSGQVVAPANSPKGSTVTIWTDAAGNLTGPPLQPGQVAGQADMASVGAITGVALLYVLATVLTRRLLNKRRMAAWAADWEVTARTWNRQRW